MKIKIIGYCLETSDGSMSIANNLGIEQLVGQTVHSLVSLEKIQKDTQRQIDMAIVAVTDWQKRYADRNDTESYQCYSRALIHAISIMNLGIMVLGMDDLRCIVGSMCYDLNQLKEGQLWHQ